jgi:hypothetical protein
MEDRRVREEEKSEKENKVARRLRRIEEQGE